MKIKIPENNMKPFLIKFHSRVHNLLFLKEANHNEQEINKCIDGIIAISSGMAQIYAYAEIPEIIFLLENLTIENNSSDFNFEKYRKTILNIHSLINSLEHKIIQEVV